MRTYLVLAILSLAAAACGGDTTSGDDDMMMPDSGTTGGDQPAFTITSKEVTLQNPGDEFTYCYYFHTPNDKPVVVNKWASNMSTGSHHMIYYFGNEQQPADGTISTDNCGAVGANGVPVWIYSAQTPVAELDLPSDDGTGKPLGMVIPAHQPGYLQLHYINQTDGPLTVTAKLDVYTMADGTPYTQTAAYITYNASISIPPHAMGDVESQTCNIPAGATFWLASTHAHKQAVKTEILDGTATVFSSTDWEHPGGKLWNTAPFYKFSSGKLTYRCTYDNIGNTAPPDNENNTIVSGQSAQTNEMCMASGYFFPASAAKFCVNSSGPF